MSDTMSVPTNWLHNQPTLTLAQTHPHAQQPSFPLRSSCPGAFRRVASTQMGGILHPTPHMPGGFRTSSTDELLSMAPAIRGTPLPRVTSSTSLQRMLVATASMALDGAGAVVAVVVTVRAVVAVAAMCPPRRSPSEVCGQALGSDGLQPSARSL